MLTPCTATRPPNLTVKSSISKPPGTFGGGTGSDSTGWRLINGIGIFIRPNVRSTRFASAGGTPRRLDGVIAYRIAEAPNTNVSTVVTFDPFTYDGIKNRPAEAATASHGAPPSTMMINAKYVSDRIG